jgi:hypothetical protein
MTRARDVANIDGVLTTTGDTYYASAAATPARLGIGSTGNVLTVAGGVPVWSAPAGGGGMTVIANGTLSGSQVSITSIPSTYVNLVLYLNNPYITSGGSFLRLRINSGTSTYGRWFFASNGNNGGDGAAQSAWNLYDAVNQNLGTSSTDYVSASVTLWNYADTTSQKSMSFQVQDRVKTFASIGGTGGTAISNTSAISSVQIITDASTFAGGTYTLYGVK